MGIRPWVASRVANGRFSSRCGLQMPIGPGASRHGAGQAQGRPGVARRGQGRRAASAHQGRETETASGWVPFNQSPSPVTKNIYFLRLSRPIANLRFRRPLLTIRLSDQRLLCPREQARPYHRPVSARHARPGRRKRPGPGHRRRHAGNPGPADSPARDRRAREPPDLPLGR